MKCFYGIWTLHELNTLDYNKYLNKTSENIDKFIFHKEYAWCNLMSNIYLLIYESQLPQGIINHRMIQGEEL